MLDHGTLDTGHVDPTDALRHRMLINFEGQGEGVTPDSVISNILG